MRRIADREPENYTIMRLPEILRRIESSGKLPWRLRHGNPRPKPRRSESFLLGRAKFFAGWPDGVG